jgi:hypothetical protein
MQWSKTIKSVAIAIVSPMVGPVVTVATTYLLQWAGADPQIVGAEPTTIPYLWVGCVVSALLGGLLIMWVWKR